MAHLRQPRGEAIVGCNIGKNTATPCDQAPADYLKCFRNLYQYADYFTINVACDPGQKAASYQTRENITKILEPLFEFRRGQNQYRPILLKVSPDLSDETIDASGRPNAIREAKNHRLIEQGGVWELRVQLCTDLDAMPVEDPTVVWNEELSPFRTVATLTVEPQTAWENGTSDKVEDRLSFSPWHGIAAHRPLGGINRARKSPYRFSADYRARFNGCPIHEPTSVDELNG